MHLNYNLGIHPSGHSPPQQVSLLYEAVGSILGILKFILICAFLLCPERRRLK
jgi:hypothetical protein